MNDAELNRIWDVSARTMEITTRELYIEGAKRDRWTWSGDARQSYLMGYYLFDDSRLARDTLFYQRGGDPVVMHINQIMDYTEQAEHDDAPDSAACCCRHWDERWWM